VNKDLAADTDCLEQSPDIAVLYLVVRKLGHLRIVIERLGRDRLVLGGLRRSLVVRLGLGMEFGRVGNRLLLEDRIDHIAVVIDRRVLLGRIVVGVGIVHLVDAVGGSLGRNVLVRRSHQMGRENRRTAGCRIDRMGLTLCWW